MRDERTNERERRFLCCEGGTARPAPECVGLSVPRPQGPREGGPVLDRPCHGNAVLSGQIAKAFSGRRTKTKHPEGPIASQPWHPWRQRMRGCRPHLYLCDAWAIFGSIVLEPGRRFRASERNEKKRNQSEITKGDHEALAPHACRPHLYLCDDASSS